MIETSQEQTRRDDEENQVMPTVEIYTTPICPYCHRAKRLLDQKGIDFIEIDIMMNPDRRSEMTRRADGRRTVPQIFINDQPIGGSDELYVLDRSGQLDRMLQTSSA